MSDALMMMCPDCDNRWSQPPTHCPRCSSFAAPSGSAAGTLRIEIDFKDQPSEYGGAPHLRMMRAIEAAYPDAKNRTASRMTWHSKPPNDPDHRPPT